MGVMATINQILDQDTTTLLIEELGTRPFLSRMMLLKRNWPSPFLEAGSEKM